MAKLDILNILNEEQTIINYLHDEGIYKVKFLRYEEDVDTTDVFYFYFSINGNVDDTARIRVGINPIVKKDGTNVIDRQTGKKLSGLDLLLRSIGAALNLKTTTGATILEEAKTHEFEMLNKHTTVEGRTYDGWSASYNDIQAYKNAQTLI